MVDNSFTPQPAVAAAVESPRIKSRREEPILPAIKPQQCKRNRKCSREGSNATDRSEMEKYVKLGVNSGKAGAPTVFPGPGKCPIDPSPLMHVAVGSSPGKADESKSIGDHVTHILKPISKLFKSDDSDDMD